MLTLQVRITALDFSLDILIGHIRFFIRRHVNVRIRLLLLFRLLLLLLLLLLVLVLVLVLVLPLQPIVLLRPLPFGLRLLSSLLLHPRFHRPLLHVRRLCHMLVLPSPLRLRLQLAHLRLDLRLHSLLFFLLLFLLFFRLLRDSRLLVLRGCLPQSCYLLVSFFVFFNKTRIVKPQPGLCPPVVIGYPRWSCRQP